jgi:FAD/FMN-containing dehydrogenase
MRLHDSASIRGFEGQILQPGDDGYDRARRVWNAMVDRRPALIARCSSPCDVAAAVRFGRSRGLEIGVRGGGHSVLGHAVPERGLMIDLSPLNAVRVDPDRRRAWVQGGALLGALDRAAQPFGLATTAGNVSHTGVGGLTLGGGMGWLARQFGLTCDNVVEFELVAADGEILRASASENADLYWGLRGGGGNFGVVTRFEFRLHEVGRAALLAELFYRPEAAAAAMRRWRDLIAEAPRQATMTAWTGTAGRWQFLPVELHDQRLVGLGFVWIGDPDEGRRWLPALRDAAAPVAERIETLSYVDLQCIDDDTEGHLRRRYWKGHYLRELPDDAIDAFVSRVGAGRMQSYGGEISAIGRGETAFAHRDALVEFVTSTSWTDDVEDEARISMARRWAAAMEPYASGVYVNVLADEGQAGVERAYGSDALARLADLKARYDPDNVFHLNHNVRPTDRGPRR